MVNFERAFTNIITDLLSRPILFIGLLIFTFIVVAELEFIATKPLQILLDNVNSTATGGQSLKSLVTSINHNLYKFTIIWGLVILMVCKSGIEIKFINSAVILFILVLSINKDRFIGFVFLIYGEYFFFTLRQPVIKIIVVVIFAVCFVFFETEPVDTAEPIIQATTPRTNVVHKGKT